MRAFLLAAISASTHVVAVPMAQTSLPRITCRENLRLLLEMRNQSTLDYTSDLEKDPFTTYYFAGFGNDTSSNVPLRWNKTLAAKAAGFVEKIK
jgi:hypothetical protein